MRTSYTFLTADFTRYFHIALVCESKGLLYRKRFKNNTARPYRVTVWGTHTDIERVTREVMA